MNYSLAIGFIIIVCANSIVGWVKIRLIIKIYNSLNFHFLTIFQRPFRIEKFNVTATSLSADIEINATVTNVDENSLYVNLKKDLQHPFAQIEFYFDSGNGLFDLKFINETIDVCRFFRDKKYLPVIQLVYKSYSDQGNFPTSCPIKKVSN